jgi:hypothetical protein
VHELVARFACQAKTARAACNDNPTYNQYGWANPRGTARALALRTGTKEGAATGDKYWGEGR